MYCHWTYNVGLFIHFLVAEVFSTQQISNYYYLKILDGDVVSRRGASRQTRQTDNYDDTAAAPVEVAMTSICTFDQEEENDRCSINIKTLGYDHPLMLNSTDQTKLVYPDNDGNIKLHQNETLFLSCPGDGNSNGFKSVPGTRSARAFRCLCGSAFVAEDTVYDFQELACKSRAKYDIVDKGFYGRESEYRKFEIGFHSSRQFLTLVEVHYDRSSASTMYVKSRLSRHIAGRQRPSKPLGRPDQTHCCERQRSRLDMDVVYEPRSQDRSFAAQLYCYDSEFPTTRCSYLDVGSAIIFNPAQLAPRDSFVYAAAGSATFVYLNTAPQWRPIGEGNWARIEAHVAEMARELDRDLLVYTGTYERLTLRDSGDGNRTKTMFLFADAAERAVPVPLYFWKIVYEPDSRRGVVYVTLNDVHAERPDDYRLCEKPMFARDGARMPKLWKPRNVAKGYSYMCEVPDFMRSTAAISFHGFSPAVVTDLLYLPKK